MTPFDRRRTVTIGSLTLFTVFFLALTPLPAVTLTVSNINDSGTGSLRDALASATDGDTINFSITGTITLTGGELLVSNSVQIVGPGVADLIVDGNASSRIFHILPDLVITISSMTISNGSGFLYGGGGILNEGSTLTVSNVSLTGNSFGGGISNVGPPDGNASLLVVNSKFTGNSAHGGGGIVNAGISNGFAQTLVIDCVVSNNSAELGGGIANTTWTGTAIVQIVNCTLAGNTVGSMGSSPWLGGGVLNRSQGTGLTSLIVSNSTFDGNSAAIGYGGAIANDGVPSGNATVEIVNSTFSNNTAGSGGAIYNEARSAVTASLQIVNCTFSGNSGIGAGGGALFNSGGGGGSAILTIANTTLSGNSASYGGAILNYGVAGGSASLQIGNSTLNGNSASFAGDNIFNRVDGQSGGSVLVEIGTTILKAGDPGTNIVNQGGTVISLGYNLSSDDGGGLLADPTDQINTDPLLGPLQDNGGPTLTHALLSGSPAIDKGINVIASATDQRGAGFARTLDDPAVPNATGGDGTDIGAFEVQINYPPGDVNSDTRVTGADSLLINQVLVGLRSNTHPVFAAAGFANGDVNTNNVVNGADSLLINQVLVGLRAYATTKILPGSHSNNQSTPVTIFGIGFPTNVVPTVSIGAPVNRTLDSVVVISREQITATVPSGGGLGTGTVNVVSSPTNGVISFGRFINQ